MYSGYIGGCSRLMGPAGTVMQVNSAPSSPKSSFVDDKALECLRPTVPVGMGDFSDVPVQENSFGRFISLYSGAGGLDIGFALAGFTPAWINEVDPYAIDTHKWIFDRIRSTLPHLIEAQWEMKLGSLLDVPESELPRRGSAELVIGGPPCQGFSVAGKMDPSDERSRHVRYFMNMVERVSPIAFVMENVKALYESRRWSHVREYLLGEATRLGYKATLMLCNASHFGVPQARERMVFIGVRDAKPIAPSTTSFASPPTLREALALLPPFGEPGNDSFCRAKVTPAKHPVMRRSPYAGMIFNGAGRPMELDSPAPTLPASMGGNKTPIVDQEEIDRDADPWIVEYHARLLKGGRPRKTIPQRMRRITVQEASTIQTFPIGMRWYGPQSAQFRQIGNAVPPRLALAVAEAVKQSLYYC